MMISRIICWLMLVSILYACQAEVNAPDLDQYYFPISALAIPQVYIYTSDIDQRHPTERWIYQSYHINNTSYLRSTNIDAYDRPVLIQEERIVSSGSLQDRIQLMSYDSLNELHTSEASIIGANVFSFGWKDTSNILFYRVVYTEPDDPLSETTIIKNRAFGGYTSYDYSGSTYKAITLHVHELIVSDKDGSIELKLSSEEIFAKGIGRVSYRKMLNKEVVLSYKLKEIRTVAEYLPSFNIE